MGLFDLLRMLFNPSPPGDAGSGADSGRTSQAPRKPGHINPFTGEWIERQPVSPAEPFDPADYAISVEYQNFRGEQKTFLGDWRTLRPRGHHISLQVGPTGQRITLSQDRIQNLPEVAAAVGRLPTGQQRRVMAFHKNRGSTSPVYEKLLESFPEWR
ncbi:MAG: hypothetical protein CMJ59_15490 [Planctomycetaceae bacterium]|nr:hypothetical protein [Planctomycetaceae bacterium]